MKAAVSQSKNWGVGKELKTMTSFFKSPLVKPLTSSLQASVPKRQKISDAQEPVGSCSRWKSAKWKDSKPPEPTSNMAIRCPGCKEVSWQRYYDLYKHISQNKANFMMTPTISKYPHERDYVKSLFENPGKALTFKCPKTYKNPHDVIAHFNIDTHNKNEVACIHESIFTSIPIHIYMLKMGKPDNICMNPLAKERV